MKKLMFAAVLAASASVFAAENGITSANIVGYTRMAVEQGVFEIIAAQFEDMAGTTKLNSLISGVEGVDFDVDFLFQKTAAQLQVPNGVGYTTYYYLNDAYYRDEAGNGVMKPGWADLNGNLVESVIPAMQGFWTKGVSGAFTLTFNK